MGLLESFSGFLREAWSNPKCDPKRNRKAMEAVLGRPLVSRSAPTPQAAALGSSPRYRWVERTVEVSRVDPDDLIQMFQEWLDVMGVLALYENGEGSAGLERDAVKLVSQFLRDQFDVTAERFVPVYMDELLAFLECMEYYEDHFEEVRLNDAA